jgi:orotidine 5'-phosphate decarboxylase subfamily 1
MLSEEFIRNNKHNLCINSLLHKQQFSEDLLYELIGYYSIDIMVRTQNITKKFLNKILNSDDVGIEESYKTADDYFLMPLKLKKRIEKINNTLAKNILQLIFQKKTNLALSLDITDKTKFLEILNNVAQHICILKTHINTINDFDEQFIKDILSLQQKYNFYILEDGKFSDIGNTFKKQLTEGVFKINNWANSITAHGIAGNSIINTYQDINNKNLDKGLIFVAEMSNKGNLITEKYTNSIVNMCNENNKLVTGFVTQKKLYDDTYLYFTPGVSIENTNDNMDQNYKTPEKAICEDDCDVIIIGRSIYNYDNYKDKCLEYKLQGWKYFINKYS